MTFLIESVYNEDNIFTDSTGQNSDFVEKLEWGENILIKKISQESAFIVCWNLNRSKQSAGGSVKDGDPSSLV